MVVYLQLVRYYRFFRGHRAVGIGTILVMLAVGIVGNALTFYWFDGPEKPDLTLGDALWYSVISITTIGYGDFSANSLGARLGTILFAVIIGLAVFSVFLGFMVDWFSDLFQQGRKGMGTIIAKDHILVVNYPSTQRVTQLIEEFRSDPEHRTREIVIITDTIEELPHFDEFVLFVRGSILDVNTFQRARINDAKMAIVLATSYTDSNSDAIVASAVAVMESQNPAIYTVAECTDSKHKLLFQSVKCDAIVSSLQISNHLLVHEAQDPGISHLTEEIVSSKTGSTLFSTLVADGFEKRKYVELAKHLLDRSVNLICVNRGHACHTSFFHMDVQPNDRIIYTATKRYSWSELLNTQSV